MAFTDISRCFGISTWHAMHGGYINRDSLYIHGESRFDYNKDIIKISNRPTKWWKR